MKPLGKAVKIAGHEQISEREVVKELLDNHRDGDGIPNNQHQCYCDGIKEQIPSNFCVRKIH